MFRTNHSSLVRDSNTWFLSVTREILKMSEVNVPRRFDAKGQHDFARYVGEIHARGRRLKQLFFDA